MTILVCTLATVLPGRLAAEDAALVDLRCTVLARKALAEDKALEPLNLAVRVRNRVATLMGPVPSAELGQRATARLARLPELVAVRNELFVDSDGAAILRKPRPGAQTARPGRASQGVLLKVPAYAPAAPKIPAQTTGSSGSAPGAVPLPKMAQPAPSAATVAIESAVRRLMQGDERYRRLSVLVGDGNVHLRGAVYRWEDVHELARAIGRIPGVNRIVLHAIAADPARR